MKTVIARRFSFESAHFLNDRFGKCKNLHGHSYKLIVEVSGRLTDGAILDFSILKKIVWDEVISRLDHGLLNDVIPFPTAENIAAWVFDTLSAALARYRDDLVLERVILYETEDSYVSVSKGE